MVILGALDGQIWMEEVVCIGVKRLDQHSLEGITTSRFVRNLVQQTESVVLILSLNLPHLINILRNLLALNTRLHDTRLYDTRFQSKSNQYG